MSVLLDQQQTVKYSINVRSTSNRVQNVRRNQRILFYTLSRSRGLQKNLNEVASKEMFERAIAEKYNTRLFV